MEKIKFTEEERASIGMAISHTHFVAQKLVDPKSPSELRAFSEEAGPLLGSIVCTNTHTAMRRLSDIDSEWDVFAFVLMCCRIMTDRCFAFDESPSFEEYQEICDQVIERWYDGDYSFTVEEIETRKIGEMAREKGSIAEITEIVRKAISQGELADIGDKERFDLPNREIIIEKISMEEAEKRGLSIDDAIEVDFSADRETEVKNVVDKIGKECENSEVVKKLIEETGKEDKS